MSLFFFRLIILLAFEDINIIDIILNTICASNSLVILNVCMYIQKANTLLNSKDKLLTY